MKKAWKFLLFVLFCLCFSGCREKGASPPPVVEQIQITCGAQGELSRVYTREDKMQRVLYCLRQQEYYGYAPLDPERVMGEEMRIDITLSDGSHRVYRQRCDRYVSRDFHRWKQVEERQSRRLRYLLRLMGSDAVANGEAS